MMVADMIQCYECNGRGVVVGETVDGIYFWGKVRCPECDGTGRIERSSVLKARIAELEVTVKTLETQVAGHKDKVSEIAVVVANSIADFLREKE